MKLIEEKKEKIEVKTSGWSSLLNSMSCMGTPIGDENKKYY